MAPRVDSPSKMQRMKLRFGGLRCPIIRRQSRLCKNNLRSPDHSPLAPAPAPATGRRVTRCSLFRFSLLCVLALRCGEKGPSRRPVGTHFKHRFSFTFSGPSVSSLLRSPNGSSSLFSGENAMSSFRFGECIRTPCARKMARNVIGMILGARAFDMLCPWL